MSFKKWLLIFALALMAVLIPAAIFNYIKDPYGYFKPKEWTEPYFTHGDLTSYARMSKPSYITTYPKKFSCVILGGSNAGFFRTKTVEEITGNTCFNSYVSSGFFGDYLALANFYIRTMPNLKEIILNISNNEIEFEHDYKKNEYFTMPSYLNGKIKMSVCIKTLLKPIKLSFLFEENEPKKDDGDTSTGEQPYEPTDDEAWIEEKVLQHNENSEESFETRIKKLCTTEEREFFYYNDSINELKEIKKLCDKNNIKLTVIIGSVFISKKEWFESNEFYEWLRQISAITEFYDFSGFYDINKNPYNFYDANHFNKTLGDKILRIVYGKEQCTDFGIKVTQENVEKYLLQRRKDYEKIKEEYQKTGTIKLFNKTHSSYVKE